MAVCPHGNMAETCHSCYPACAEPERKAPLVPPPPSGHGDARCPHDELAAGCLKCFPERAG